MSLKDQICPRIWEGVEDECLSVSRWFMLPQTFSRLQTVFTKGWAPLHLVLFGCLCLWFFGFVFLVLFWKVQGVF